MKTLPNLLTISRILLSLCLLLTTPLSAPFYILYIWCGLSDVADGYLARKTKTSSQLGAKLDSIADFVFCMIILVIFIPLINWANWLLLWILLIFLIRLASILVGFCKHHRLMMLHTYGNKITGLLLFFFPFFFSLWATTPTAILLCIVATISALDELLINIFSTKPNLNCKSILHIK